MNLKNKLTWIIEYGMNPTRSEIHSFITYSPIDYKDFSRFWEFHRYETIYYCDIAEWILEEIYDENQQEYLNHHFINDMEYIKNLVNKMYEDGQKGHWGFVFDW